MYEKPIPKTAEAREKIAASLARRNAAAGISAFLFAILAILSLVGIVVILFVFEFGKLPLSVFTACLAGFAGATVLLAVCAFFLTRHSTRLEGIRRDFLELCDGEESFFVGETTLATFCEEGLCLHAQDRPEIFVPYRDIRLFSLCTRKHPREQGEWSVVFEIPASYLAKDKKGAEGTALIQTDAKPRLFAAIGRHGLTAEGERDTGKRGSFHPQKKFYIPDRKLTRRAIFLLAAGAVLAAAGIPLAILLDVAAGAVCTFFGLLLLVRGLSSFLRARAMFGVYEEGIYWASAGRTDCLFLKWEGLTLSREVKDAYAVIVAACAYGAYRFPCPQDAWGYLMEHYPDKIGK